jgi:SAM-dependent methyltransferase
MEQSVYQQFYEIEKDHWWFIGMRKICRSLLENTSDYSKIRSGRCLDVGCGTGLWTRELAFPDGSACGLDFSEDALAFCQQRGLKKLVRASGVSLPFLSSSHQAISALGVVEHLEDDRSFLVELSRVCSPGGYVLILTSAYNFLWSRHDDIVHHKRRYTKKDLKKLVDSAGLDPVRVSYVNTFLFGPIILFRFFQKILGLDEKGEKADHGSPDLFVPLSTVNAVLTFILWLEAKLLGFINLPFGVGIVVLARKPHILGSSEGLEDLHKR